MRNDWSLGEEQSAAATMAELRGQVSRKCSLWEHARHPAAVDNAACWLEACVSSEVQSSFAALPLPS